MHNKKYIVTKIEEFHRHNPLYDGMEGNTCYLAYLKPGERGWFLCVRDDWFDPTPHRVHTTTIKDVTYTRDNTVIVSTQNTRFTFEVKT